MKCPFQTKTITTQLNTQAGSVTTTEFADCIEKECPYFGWDEIRTRQNGGFSKVVVPGCRRVKEGRNRE